LKPEGKMLIVEPPFHVSGKEFRTMLHKIENIGFKIISKPKYFMNKSALVSK